MVRITPIAVIGAIALLPVVAAQGTVDRGHTRRHCGRFHSKGDSWARILARTAEVAAETLATDHNGSYTTVSPHELHKIEPFIAISRRQAVREQLGAYLVSASGTSNSYRLETVAFDGDWYTLERTPGGEITRADSTCVGRGTW